MNLFCPDCGALIVASDVNVQTGLAKCAKCNSVFNIAQRLAAQREAAPRDEELLPQPPEMRVEELGLDWNIHWRWFNASYFGLLIFCIAWDSFLIFWYRIAFTSSHAPWIMVVFPIGHVAVGIGLTYAVLCGFLNSTTVQRSGYELRVIIGPVPTFGNRRLSIHDIVLLFCERSESKNRNNRMQETYTLLAVTRDGKRIKLLSNKSAGHAKFLEREIERRLGLKNQPVAGEMSRA
jgi:predicted Zn finger-like uncharacterized protein